LVGVYIHGDVLTLHPQHTPVQTKTDYMIM
jgi:hypothetical protein